MEEWKVEIPELEAELQHIQEKLNKAKYEKAILENLKQKLEKKKAKVITEAKQLWKVVFVLQ